MSSPLSDPGVNAYLSQLFTLARTLKIDPMVPENQVLDRVALCFRKLLNFMAQHDELTTSALLTSPLSLQARTQLSEIMQENFAAAQQSGVFRQDIPVAFLAQFFTSMLLQLTLQGSDPAARHQHSLAATKLFCEGAWAGSE